MTDGTPVDGERAATDGGTPSGGSRRLADPLLRVDGVTAGYGATTVLRDVGFDVGDGEVVGLVGRNGAGKTTTLRTVTGQVPPGAGSITYDGADVTGAAPEETVRRGIALVPEERRIFGGLSVRENLELAELGGSGDAGYTIDEVLGTFGNLADRETAPGSALSGGEQQMLAIARALVSGARFLMLDEPTEGLAPYVIERVVDTVEDLRSRGLTVLLVEQNVHVALDLCDHVYVMADGRIVHDAPSADLADDDQVLDRYLGVRL